MISEAELEERFPQIGHIRKLLGEAGKEHNGGKELSADWIVYRSLITMETELKRRSSP